LGHLSHCVDVVAVVDEGDFVDGGVAGGQGVQPRTKAAFFQQAGDRPQPLGVFRVVGGVMFQVEGVVDKAYRQRSTSWVLSAERV
jgi:hypothetical protein